MNLEVKAHKLKRSVLLIMGHAAGIARSVGVCRHAVCPRIGSERRRGLSKVKPKQAIRAASAMGGTSFGAFIRRQRETREIGLRGMAKMIGVSATYLSKVERNEIPPPTEAKVRAIARIIECDADELLARAGRLASDLSDIIKNHPVELAALLRTTKTSNRRSASSSSH